MPTRSTPSSSTLDTRPIASMVAAAVAVVFAARALHAGAAVAVWPALLADVLSWSLLGAAEARGEHLGEPGETLCSAQAGLIAASLFGVLEAMLALSMAAPDFLTGLMVLAMARLAASAIC